jgi:dienelactone hydrolase
MHRSAALLFTLVLSVLIPTASWSQTLSAAGIKELVSKYPQLKFQDEPKEELGTFTNISNTIFKPEGQGPFPAVVLVHTCGGIKDSHIRTHAKEMLEEGYVILVQDSFNPRGSPDCGLGNRKALPALIAASDGYAALAHLSKLPFVDAKRIYQVGYSWGAFGATLLASSNLADNLGVSARFRATVANYSTCKFLGRDFLLTSTDRPVLMLMGEKDAETPPASCFPLLQELKDSGKPVSWHVFPGTTHGWDKTGQTSNGYIYNKDVAREATRRMIEFFKQNGA